MVSLIPRPGRWYRMPDHSIFRVVVTDPDHGAIEIQYPDGERERLDRETWEHLSLVALDDAQAQDQAPDSAAPPGRTREWLGNEAASPLDRRFG